MSEIKNAGRSVRDREIHLFIKIAAGFNGRFESEILLDMWIDSSKDCNLIAGKLESLGVGGGSGWGLRESMIVVGLA